MPRAAAEPTPLVETPSGRVETAEPDQIYEVDYKGRPINKRGSLLDTVGDLASKMFQKQETPDDFDFSPPGYVSPRNRAPSKPRRDDGLSRAQSAFGLIRSPSRATKPALAASGSNESIGSTNAERSPGGLELFRFGSMLGAFGRKESGGVDSARKKDTPSSAADKQRLEQLERAALPPGTLHAGFLKKQGEGGLGFAGGHAERWVVLRRLKGAAGELIYYTDKDCATEKGRTPLDGGTVVASAETITFKGAAQGGATVHLRAATAQEAQAWVERLTPCLKPLDAEGEGQGGFLQASLQTLRRASLKGLELVGSAFADMQAAAAGNKRAEAALGIGDDGAVASSEKEERLPGRAAAYEEGRDGDDAAAASSNQGQAPS